MKILLIDHYQSMSVRFAPGMREVNAQTGKYLVENGYAVAYDEASTDADLGADGDRDAEDADLDASLPDAPDDADLQAMTKGQLLNIARAGGIELSDRLNKQAIIDELIAHGKK
jgi:hypothetical protein